MNVKEQLACKLIEFEIITEDTKIVYNYQILELGINPKNYIGGKLFHVPYVSAQPQTLMRKWVDLKWDFWDWNVDNEIYVHCQHEFPEGYKFKGLDSQGKDNKTEYTLHPKFYSWLKQYVKEIKEKK